MKLKIVVAIVGISALAVFIAQSPEILDPPKKTAQTTHGNTKMENHSLIGHWIITKAEGVNVKRRELRLEISPTDSKFFTVFGITPCRSFRAKLHALEKEFSLMFDRPDTDTKICEKEIMDEERKYNRLLARLSHYEITEEGTLIISSFGTPMIYATLETKP